MILVDISGYTRFIQYHKISLLHAEKIIGELMESILRQVKAPVIAHEILGDAITMYALDEGVVGQADSIYTQLQHYFEAFQDCEARLISACTLCRCHACQQVGRLKLKAILHHGHAAFTHVHTTRKISGFDVIMSHRLLKNTLPSKEYILMTSTFFDQCQEVPASTLIAHQETYDDVGRIQLYAKILDQDIRPARMNLLRKIWYFFPFETYLIKRLFIPNPKQYRNMPE